MYFKVYVLFGFFFLFFADCFWPDYKKTPKLLTFSILTFRRLDKEKLVWAAKANSSPTPLQPGEQVKRKEIWELGKVDHKSLDASFLKISLSSCSCLRQAMAGLSSKETSELLGLWSFEGLLVDWRRDKEIKGQNKRISFGWFLMFYIYLKPSIKPLVVCPGNGFDYLLVLFWCHFFVQVMQGSLFWG